MGNKKFKVKNIESKIKKIQEEKKEN